MNFNIEWHERLGSTNQHMRDGARRGEPISDGSVIATREQTAGRGRQDRRWIAPAGRNLCFSLFVQTDAPLNQTPALTIATALAVDELLHTHHIPSTPKWPNDVLVNTRKICGILSERIDPTAVQPAGIIVGIGLNINLSSEEAETIDRPATSMMIETGQRFVLKDMLDSLLPRLADWINLWKKGGFQAFAEDWTRKTGPIGKHLSVHDGPRIKTGRLAGYGPSGELLLETEAGVETIWSGDVV